MYSIIFLPEAEKVYKKLASADKSIFLRIANSLEALKGEPLQGKPLKGRLEGKRSLRVGNFRIIYSVIQQKLVVYVFDIGHRREVYR